MLATKVDHCFRGRGLTRSGCSTPKAPKRTTGPFQRSRPCYIDTYDNEAIIRRMVEEQRDIKVSTEMIPRCPKCGAPMAMNPQSDDTFVEDEGGG